MILRIKAIGITNLLLLAISIVPFFLDHKQAVAYSPHNYFIVETLLILIAFFIKKEFRNKFLLSPSFIAASYVNLNFFVGGLAFKHGLSFDIMLIPYSNWQHMNLSMAYFNLANFFIINTYFISKRIKFFKVPLLYDMRKVGKSTLITLGISLIILFSFVGIDMSFFSSAQSDYYVIPKSIGALILIAVLFNHFKLKIRLIFYAIIIAVFAISSFEDKRDAIFLILPILLLESTRYPFILGLKRLFLVGVTVVFVGYLIIVMSILRGYGEYHPEGFIGAMSYVTDYIRSESFVPSFMNNIEASYTFFHSHNAVERVIDDPELLSYGSTIIKPFFIVIPRSYYPDKPESIIDLYTTAFSKEMRKAGYSAPISFQSEMFWNFQFFGIVAAVLFFFVFNSLYLSIIHLIEIEKIVNFLPLLYIYQQSLVLFRGSGLDQFAIDIVLSFIIFAIVQIITRLIVSSKPKRI